MTKRERDPPKKSGEYLRTRHTSWASPENRAFHGFYSRQRGGPRPHGMGHKRLLKDLRVKRWYDDLSRGSQMTAQVYLRRSAVCSTHDSNDRSFDSAHAS